MKHAIALVPAALLASLACQLACQLASTEVPPALRGAAGDAVSSGTPAAEATARRTRAVLGHWRPELSAPRWVIPSAGLPARLAPQAANNNLDLALHEGRLFLAWRSAPTHFASSEAALHVMSSPDEGQSWAFEHRVATGNDLREPRLLSMRGRLTLHYFQGGTNPLAFEPQRLLRMSRRGPGRWSGAEPFGRPGEVLWDLELYGGRAYRTSYVGNHYGKGLAAIDVLFQTSRDGRTWEPVERERPVVYHGGVSEAAIAFDGGGTLWVVTRNEDGDASGFGSHLCRAAPARLARWSCPTTADPERYDSPQLFEHEGEVYLLARRDVGGPFDQGRRELPLLDRRSRNIVQYSLRPKRTALYVLDRRTQKVVHLADLPSAGDTAYPAVVRSGPHRFLIANYSSPLADPERSWIRGQLSDEGTQIYLMELRFVRR